MNAAMNGLRDFPPTSFRATIAGLILVCASGFTTSLRAQETPAPVSATTVPAEKKLTPAQEKFAKDFQDWKNLLAQLRILRLQYKALESSTDKQEIAKEYQELIAKGTKLGPLLRAQAEAVYQEDPKASLDVERFLASEAEHAIERSDYEEAARLAELLADKGYNNAAIYRLAGVSLVELGQHDKAKAFLEKAKAQQALDVESNRLLEKIDELKTAWGKESEIRAAEAKKDDLPRVLLKTNRGDITIELFENEAPNTVANFINLVEKKYYDGLTFHRVIEGFMAQGGDPNGDGSGGPGYHIPDECKQDNHRLHFRGSLSMAKTAQPDTGGSQFFLTFRSTPHLDGQHTVFGRVIKGMDTLLSLRIVDPERPDARITPDRILEATVLRKRDHEYVVRKVEDGASSTPAPTK